MITNKITNKLKVMKTRIATLMFLAVLFITSTAFATPPVTATAAARNSVKELLKKELTYPEFAIEQKLECCVVVSITIQDDGSFEVDEANCVCPSMKTEVVKDIESLGGDKFAKYAGQHLHMKVKYTLIS